MATEIENTSEQNEIESACYAMQMMYQTESNMYSAVAEVQKLYPELRGWEIEIMWRAIDAYVDINL